MKIDFAGFGVFGYRSYAAESMARVGPMAKVHLVVGQNNVGKSNLLQYISAIGDANKQSPIGNYTNLFSEAKNVPRGWHGSEKRSISFCFHANSALWEHMRISSRPDLQKIFEHEAYSLGDKGYVWFDFDINSSFHLRPRGEQFFKARAAGSTTVSASDLLRLVSNTTTSNEDEDLKSYFDVLQIWNYAPRTKTLEAIREITADTVPGSTIYDGLGKGRGLIQTLAQLERPPAERFDDYKPKFRQIEDFVRNVLDDHTINLEVPRPESTIMMTSPGHMMTLDSMGSGIAEIIMLAAMATLLEDHLICIEEPELHLHPAQQRKLLKYLQEHTQNRYLISTHSAALLNSSEASISHVTMSDRRSSVQNLSLSSNIAHAVADLGNRASDLVQSNFVVWVEGPSDRIYINHWISLLAPDLAEGAHYSTLLYGGSTLSHLTAEEEVDPDAIEDTSKFISLLRVNRNFSVVIDSDKADDSSGLNETKNRVKNEVTDIGAHLWITDGYTIENYVPKSWLELALAAAHPRSKAYPVPDSFYVSPLAEPFPGTNTYPSKVKVARAVVSAARPLSEWNADLMPHIVGLVSAIRVANGLA